MLQELDCRKNLEDGLPYTACAGVAVVHKEYPLYSAYKRSEELCRDAKIYSETNHENSVKLSKKIMADF
jgi:CRISPR/Cas system-associated protein Cas10 (large subunit of type III CRISPR-Cas system)